MTPTPPHGDVIGDLSPGTTQGFSRRQECINNQAKTQRAPGVQRGTMGSDGLRIRKSFTGTAAAALLIGSAATAQEVTLQAPGAGEDLTQALENASQTIALEDQAGDEDPEDPTAQDYVAAARADYRRLLTALYAEGYYGGAISIGIDGTEAASIQPLGAPPSIRQVVITVDIGPQFDFGRTEIGPLAPDTELPEGFTRGEVARSETVRDAVRASVQGWRQTGNAKADVASQDLTARHEERILDVGVRIAPGPQLTFGPLLITGNQAVRTERIRAIAGLPTGEVFDPDELDMAAQRLRRTGAFSAAALEEAEEIGPGSTLPITARIVEQKPRRIGFGIEVSSVEGLRVSAFWMHRNLLGGAERFRVEGEVSGIGSESGEDYSLTTTFNRPATFGPDSDLFINSEIARIDDPGYFIDRFSAEIGVNRILTPDFEVSAAVGIQSARVRDELGERDYTFLTLPLTAEYDKRNKELDATRGYYLDGELTPFVGLDGEVAGGRFYGDARGYLSFGEEDRFTFAGRTQIGSVFGAEIEEAPADYLFFSGGGGTVRGQPYQDLGVTVNGAEVGGRSFAGAQLEARIGITEKLGAVAFYDVGMVGPDPVLSGDDDWHAGAGLGVRYDTGIGPIRVDLGTPASGDDIGESAQLYIGIGQAF